MGLFHRLMMSFNGTKNAFVPILTDQAEFLCSTSRLLLSMFETKDASSWARTEHEIKSCETQGDALLTEFHELLNERLVQVDKLDLQAVSMAMDDCLDVIKDTSKAILIYAPEHLDDQLKDLAHIIVDQAEALKKMVPELNQIKKHYSSISLCCERVTELEHAADDAYEDYIGYIFNNMDDVKELVKCKNLAEMLENATDACKKISDNVRKLLLNHMSK